VPRPDEVYVKRLIALPSDTVEVKEGTVYVNGFALDEPYIKEAPTYTFPLTELGEDEYFVLGDNRNNANDSSKGWTISRDAIIGKALFSYWPLSQWGRVNNYPLGDQLEAAAD
jgi:signal peptidase I